jgi:PAS domain S-box-containing protein
MLSGQQNFDPYAAELSGGMLNCSESTRAGSGPQEREPQIVGGKLFDRLSLKWKLILIVSAAICPLVFILFWAVSSLGDTAERHQREDLAYTAKSIAATADAELGKYRALAGAIGRSPLLRLHNLSQFEAHANQVLPPSADAWVIVHDLEGQQLLNTRSELMGKLVVRNADGMENQRRAFATREPAVSGIIHGPATSTWGVSIDYPIFKNGQPFRSLTVVISAQRFASLLHPADVPSHWLNGIMDASGRYIARTPDPGNLTGQLASEGWRKTLGQNGIFEFPTREGDYAINANAILRSAPWTVGVGAKKSELQASTIGTLKFGAAGIVLCLLLSLFLATALGRTLTRSLAEFRKSSAALIAGALPSDLSAPSLPELQEPWKSLCAAVEARERQEGALHKKTQQLETLVASAPIGIAYFDRGHRYLQVNSELAEINGVSIEDHIGRAIEDVLPRNAEAVSPVIDHVFATGEVVRGLEVKGETPLRRGEIRYWLCGFFPVRNTHGAVEQVGAWVVEITERKRAEDQLKLLMGEVNHRSKNLLAVIQAIARQTAKEADPREFLNLFSQRLSGLAANQDLLVKTEWRGVHLADIVQAQIKPFAAVQESRISLSGPDIEVTPAASQAFALAIHELATNASKYGALSTPNGRIDIRWSIELGELRLAWVEQNGPSVSQPSRRGFGTVVISELTKSALKGSSDLEFASSGVIWHVRCPVSAITRLDADPTPNTGADGSPKERAA